MVNKARETIQSSCLNNMRKCLRNIRRIGEEEEGDRGDMFVKILAKENQMCMLLKQLFGIGKKNQVEKTWLRGTGSKLQIIQAHYSFL